MAIKGRTITRELVTFENKLYHVVRIIKRDLNPNIEVWKEHLMVDKVIQNKTHVFFVMEVPDVEIISES